MASTVEERLAILKMATDLLPHALREPHLYVGWTGNAIGAKQDDNIKSTLRALYNGVDFVYKRLEGKGDVPAQPTLKPVIKR